MLSRRKFVGKLATSAAVACAAGVSSAEGKIDHKNSGASSSTGAADHQLGIASATSETAAPAPWELLRPLALGSAVAHGWSIAGLTGAVDGSCVVTLQNARGRSHRVHLCRHDGRPQGLVYTRRFDLVVMNGGEGDLPTDEGFAQAIAEVAHALAANETQSQHEPVITALLTHAERLERFGAAAKLR